MKKDIFRIILWLVVCLLLLSILTLPDYIPIRFDIRGNIERYGSRYYLIFVHLLPIITYYGMEYTKKIDPKRENILKKEDVYELYRKLLSIFFIILSIYLTYLSKVEVVNNLRFLCFILGLLLICMGNYMPKIPQNYFFGIKTIWTIRDEYIWKKTHRVGGIVCVICGIFYLICSMKTNHNILIYSTLFLLVSCIYLYIYSYQLYKRKGN